MPEKWKCPECGKANSATRVDCWSCGRPRDAEAGDPAPEAAQGGTRTVYIEKKKSGALVGLQKLLASVACVVGVVGYIGTNSWQWGFLVIVGIVWFAGARMFQ
jgi:hypothetical protein